MVGLDLDEPDGAAASSVLSAGGDVEGLVGSAVVLADEVAAADVAAPARPASADVHAPEQLFPSVVLGTAGDPLERWYTPEPLAAAIVDGLLGWNDEAPRTVVEPSVGGGAFARAVRRRWPSSLLIGIDADPEAAGLAICDRRHVDDWPRWARGVLGERGALVVGNPPFKGAIEHVAAAQQVCGVVAFILPLAYLGGAKWRPLRDRLASVQVIDGRPWECVREVALWTWRRGHVGPAALPAEPIRWKS